MIIIFIYRRNIITKISMQFYWQIVNRQKKINSCILFLFSLCSKWFVLNSLSTICVCFRLQYVIWYKKKANINANATKFNNLSLEEILVSLHKQNFKLIFCSKNSIKLNLENEIWEIDGSHMVLHFNGYKIETGINVRGIEKNCHTISSVNEFSTNDFWFIPLILDFDFLQSGEWTVLLWIQDFCDCIGNGKIL